MNKIYLKIVLMILIVFVLYGNAVFAVSEIAVTDFAYVINGAEINDLLNTTFDLVIIDYSKDGTEYEKCTPAQIQSLKDNNTIPIAYFSIGEAEDYRYYWKKNWGRNPPSWLGEENPNWKGNYKVRYWQQAWKDIMFDYLDKILELGFDGVMLDIVDAYYYWSEEMGEVSAEFAATEMINFIYEIYAYAVNKTGNKNFMVFPQNAVEILDYDREGNLIDSITGLSVENLFFDSDNTQTNRRDRNYRLEYLEQYKKAGKLILVTDYIYPNQSTVKNFYSKADSYGFVSYAADRSAELDSVIIIEGTQPEN